MWRGCGNEWGLEAKKRRWFKKEEAIIRHRASEMRRKPIIVFRLVGMTGTRAAALARWECRPDQRGG